MNQLKKIKKNKESFNTQMPLILSMIVICALIVLTIMLIPLINSIFSKKSFLCSFTSLLTVTNNLGGTIGGLLGPIVALMAALLTYWAFMEQVKANKKQAKQFKKQFRDQKRATFENRFFELLTICNSKRNEANLSDQNHDFFHYALRYFEFHRKIYYCSFGYGEINSINKNYFKQLIPKELKGKYIYFYSSIFHITYPMFFGIIKYQKTNKDEAYNSYINNLDKAKISEKKKKKKSIFASCIDIEFYNDNFELNELLHFKGGIYRNIISYLESLRLLLNYISSSNQKKIINSEDMTFFFDLVKNEITENEALFLFIFQLMKESENGFFTNETIKNSNIFQKINMAMLFDFFDPTVGLVPFSSIEEYYKTKASLNL